MLRQHPEAVRVLRSGRQHGPSRLTRCGFGVRHGWDVLACFNGVLAVKMVGLLLALGARAFACIGNPVLVILGP